MCDCVLLGEKEGGVTSGERKMDVAIQVERRRRNIDDDEEEEETKCVGMGEEGTDR